MPKVKIIDVAREAGVSLGTVSNALNHPDRVRPETRRVIQETIRRLGYTPNQSARLLAGGRNPMFGLVLPCLDHGFCLQVISGAQHEAKRNGYGLLVSNYNTDQTLREQYEDYFMGTQLAGVLVQATEPIDGAEYQTPSTPVVYLDTTGDAPAHFVTADCRAQGRLTAEHAIARDAHHIAVMGSGLAPHIQLRLEGIREALSAYPDIALEVFDDAPWNDAEAGFQLGAQLARRTEEERPDFVIGLTDVLATGAIAGISAAGCAVPDDVRVAGCDGNILAWTGPISLTTCAPAGYEVGRKGVQLLLEQISARESVGPRHIDVKRRTSGVSQEARMTEPRVEIVRPFLLERESTSKGGAQGGPHGSDAAGVNLGTYL